MSDSYRRLLEMPYPGDERGRTYVERIAEIVCNEADLGDLAAVREIADHRHVGLEVPNRRARLC